MTYYERRATTHLDGSPVFKTAEDEQSETEVAASVAAAWRCRLHSFGRLAPIDWWAERDGRVVGVLELKSRSHATSEYETVFFNVRKWLALTLASVGMGVPAVFVVRFTDGIRYISVTAVDAKRVRIGGTRAMVKSRSDIEPVIEVPVASMASLHVPQEVAS